MALPRAVVIDADVLTGLFRGFSSVSAFWNETTATGVRVAAVDGLQYEVLDGLVEDSAFGARIERYLAVVLYDQVMKIIDELQARGTVVLIPSESFLSEAFEVAVSEGLAFARCVAASVAFAQQLPLIVVGSVQKQELTPVFGGAGIETLALEELY